MDDINQDNSEVLENTETTETEAVETPEVAEPTIEELKAQLEEERKAREETDAKNKQLFERVKKAETKPAPQVQQDGLSNKDVIYLAKADIHADDVDEVLEMARAKKWDMKRAHEYMKPILAVRAEERDTAKGANISNVRRGPSKVTDEVLVSNASRGNLPDDEEGIERLIAAKLKQK
jgi:hypothetical protein